MDRGGMAWRGQKSSPSRGFSFEASTGFCGTSSLLDPGRHITIVTTASLPWMTGTAINPLLRAAYLARRGAERGSRVTLLIPWLAPCDQRLVFPDGRTFATPAEQEEFVREWVADRAGFRANFRVSFYAARYAAEKCSILPVGDPSACVPEHEADVAVLEEPEHLTWYHHGARWSRRFRHVVGVMHTNYLDYARRETGGAAKEAVLKRANALLCRAHCHKVIKLSDAVQRLPRQVTEFVHGVPEAFLDVGRRVATMKMKYDNGKDGDSWLAGEQVDANGEKRLAHDHSMITKRKTTKDVYHSKGAYFIGKVVWAKGYTELLELVGQLGKDQAPLTEREDRPQHRASTSSKFVLDCYGTGDDAEEVMSVAQERGLPLAFHGARDHLAPQLHAYRCFVNPSTSDVVATTTAEALAMGKWVVCADLPCNAFFKTFDNCLVYRTPEEFASRLQHALTNEPKPLAAADAARLGWEAATDRFLAVSELKPTELRPSVLTRALDVLCYSAHNALTGVEPLRAAAGAGIGTRDAPPRLLDYDPSRLPRSHGGLFDNRRRSVSRHASVAAALGGEETA